MNAIKKQIDFLAKVPSMDDRPENNWVRFRRSQYSTSFFGNVEGYTVIQKRLTENQH